MKRELNAFVGRTNPHQPARADVAPKLFTVRGCEVECRPRNHEVPSWSPGSGSQLWDFSLAHTFRHEYWCSSQEAESREISISCKNLFLNRYKINMFKLKLTIFKFSACQRTIYIMINPLQNDKF